MALFRRQRGESGTVGHRAWADALAAAAPPPHANGPVVNFVRTGSDPRVLSWLSGQRLGGGPGSGSQPANPAAVHALYAGFADTDAATLRRWASVLQAAWGAQTWGWVLGTVAGSRWPELMLRQVAQVTPTNQPLPVSFTDFVRIAESDGAGPETLLHAMFEVQQYSRYQRDSARDQLPRMPGFAAALLEHQHLVGRLLTSGSAESKTTAISLIAATLSDHDLRRFAGPLTALAVGSSNQVRGAARAVSGRLGDSAVQPLRTLATTGPPDQRARALELLARRADSHDWAIATAQADRAASVQALATQWQAPAAQLQEEAQTPALAPQLINWAVPAEAAARIARETVDALTAAILGQNRQREQWARQAGQSVRPAELLPPPPKHAARDVADLLVRSAPARAGELAWNTPVHISGVVLTDAAKGELGIVAAVKLILALGLTEDRWGHSAYTGVLEAVHSRTGGPDLLTLQRMFDESGTDGVALIWTSYAYKWGGRLGRGWPADQVSPFVAANLDAILATSEATRDSWSIDPNALFTAIATLPARPARLVDWLYSTALTGRKADRPAAQAALADDPNRLVRVAAALQDGKGQTRQVAAQWLGRAGDRAALPALRAAWTKERQDVVRGALLDALVAIGEDPATYLDPQAMLTTAEAFVAKGLPGTLSWLDWDAVPTVTWASSGEPVPLAVVQWMCGTAVKTKSPEPDAVLRHYAALFDPSGRQRVAHHLLQVWMAEDLRPMPAAQAEQIAQRDALSNHRWWSQDGPLAGMTVQQMVAAILPNLLRQPAGSATASKGLLATVAACGGSDLVAPTERYLREWYGQRAAQGKALIGMLAWVDDPAATQLVLSIGSRFRTKSFQDEANRQVQALADRKGWTIEELADRTIPTAGFDDHGELELPYGPRTFTARLLPDLAIELRDPEGKAIKTLPVPRQSDDTDLANQSKKQLSAAKKQLKAIATLQKQRLYEAMCTQRSWPAQDWQRYLQSHPVVGPSVRRLVWIANADGDNADDGEPLVFRPLDDGSLTDVEDNDAELPEHGRIRLAHDSLLTPEQVQAWSRHLADYEIAPLFQQLGRGLHAMSAEQAASTEMDDFKGHLLDSFALRSRALRLGYTRGAPVDGPWFTTYHRRFPTLDLIATIEFSGNMLPEENRPVALIGLSFAQEAPDGAGSVPLALGDVPAVLVSECWNDLRALAAQGTGFDPDWERKAGL